MHHNHVPIRFFIFSLEIFWLTLCFHELVRGSKSFNGKNVNVVVRYQFLYLIDIQIDLT